MERHRDGTNSRQVPQCNVNRVTQIQEKYSNRTSEKFNTSTAMERQGSDTKSRQVQQWNVQGGGDTIPRQVQQWNVTGVIQIQDKYSNGTS